MTKPMAKPRTNKRFLALLALTALFTACLGACGTEKPTPLVIPEVVWTHGPPKAPGKTPNGSKPSAADRCS